MRYFVSETKEPLTFSACGQLVSKEGFLHHNRCFDWNVLIVVTEGILHITADGIPYELGPDQYLFLRAGETHFGHQASEGKLSYLWVHLKADKTFAVTDENGTEMRYTYFIPESGRIASSKRMKLLFRQLLDMAMEEQLYTTEMLDYSVSLLMMELTQEMIDQRSHKKERIPQVVFSVVEWIKANYYKQISVQQLANEFGYQADYLSALFKKHMRSTLVQYVNKIRIENAKKLLADYGLSIKETAYACGFPDEKYFMKVFKKTEGLTPTQYKNAYYKKLINS
ncbi:MAG: AraC family transcriptional regulator [Lachnospiraceae bacterium]